MTQHPSAEALVAAVRAFLVQAEGALSGRHAFEAKVAANALAIVERELAQAPEQAERQALAGLTMSDGRVDTQRATVCAGLRDGRLTPATPGLLDALETSVLARLAVDNPRYSTFRRMTGEERG